MEIAAINNAACTKITLSFPSNPATPAITIAGVTHPTIIATTCCENFGIPFNSKTDAYFLSVFIPIVLLSLVSHRCSADTAAYHYRKYLDTLSMIDKHLIH